MSRWAEAFADIRKRDTCDTLRHLDSEHPEPDAGVKGVTGVTPVENAIEGPPDPLAGFVTLSTGDCPDLDACDGWCDACRAIRDTRLPAVDDARASCPDMLAAGLLAGYRRHAGRGVA